MSISKRIAATILGSVLSGSLTLPCSAQDAPLAVTVDWSKTVAQAGPSAYGLNAFSGFEPAVTVEPKYQANLRFMAPGLLRLHNWGMMGDAAKDPSGWIDTAHRRWDAAKIKAALAGFAPHALLLINIPGWPDWMDNDKDGFLDVNQTKAYARFCADLVKIVNRDFQKHVVYWEVTNEQDGRYFVDFHTNGGWGALKDAAKPDRVEELAGIYNQCAAAMKAVDPAIKVGGPAIERPDLTEFIRRFVHAAGPQLDFFSYHAYASGSGSDSDDTIFDRATGFGGATRTIAETVKTQDHARSIPLFFDEYNISWTWETHDPRMTTVKSAVFDALAITSAVTNGAAATTAWNERDGIYGKMDNEYHLRPSATLFHWLNTNMVGSVVSTASADPKTVVAYAVLSKAKRKALLLINRSAHEQKITLTSWTEKRISVQCLAPPEAVLPLASTLPSSLPADSVTLLTAN